MYRVLLAELRKLRRPTLLFPTLLAVTSLTALSTSLLYLLIDSPSGNGREGIKVTPAQLSMSSGSVFGFQQVATLLGIIALCVFAGQTAQEYTYGTLRNLLVRQPSRLKILGGKFISMALFALILVIFSELVSIGLSMALASGAHVRTGAWFSSDGRHYQLQALGNVYVAALGFGIVGMILGIVLRSPITAISIGVIWTLIVENLLTVAVKNIDQWLPGQLLNSVAMGGNRIQVGGQWIGSSYTHALDFSALYLLAASLVAALLFKYRDVAN